MGDGIVWLRGAAVYQKDFQVLSDVYLNINPGSFAYLIGRTGSGKTSLLKTLYGALPLKVGEGIVAGFNLRDLNRRTIPLLRRKLGIVFQDFSLLTDRNVEENLSFVLRATGWTDGKGIDFRIDEVLESVNLARKRSAMPHELSGGEQQRVAIARALATGNPIMLADEPTGELDFGTGVQILDLLQQQTRDGRAVLVVTHNREISRMADRVVELSSGQIVADGPPQGGKADVADLHW